MLRPPPRRLAVFSAFVGKGIVDDLHGFYSPDTRTFKTIISLGRVSGRGADEGQMLVLRVCGAPMACPPSYSVAFANHCRPAQPGLPATRAAAGALQEVCGFPRVVHGGLTAAIIDESFGGLLFALKQQKALSFWGPGAQRAERGAKRLVCRGAGCVCRPSHAAGRGPAHM